MPLKILLLLTGTLLLAQQATPPEKTESIESLKAENARLSKELADSKKLLDYWLRSSIECQVRITNDQIINGDQDKKK